MLTLAILIFGLTASSASAETFVSAFQDITLKSCRDQNPIPPGQRSDHATVPFACPKFAGFSVSYIAYPNSNRLKIEPPGMKVAQGQLQFAFGLGSRIEWRGLHRTSGLEPRVLIVRTGIADEGGKRVSLLNILKVERSAVCLAGVVDASANPDANALARKAADTIARNHVCAQSLPEIHGVETSAAKAGLEQVE